MKEGRTTMMTWSTNTKSRYLKGWDGACFIVRHLVSSILGGISKYYIWRDSIWQSESRQPRMHCDLTLELPTWNYCYIRCWWSIRYEPRYHRNNLVQYHGRVYKTKPSPLFFVLVAYLDRACRNGLLSVTLWSHIVPKITYFDLFLFPTSV
jgi:hypothetical protein